MNKPSYILFFSLFVIMLYSVQARWVGSRRSFTIPWNSFETHCTIQKMPLVWKKTSLFFWILLVLAVWTVIYVFMCDVLWSKNRGAWLRRTIFSPNFSLNWRFIQNPYMLSRFQGPGVDESRSKLWWNNFINVDKMVKKRLFIQNCCQGW